MSYFYDENENIKEDFVTKSAKIWAQSFIKPKRPEKKGEKNPPLSSTQLRKFHFEIKTIEERLKNKPNPKDEYEKLRPLVKMIKSKVAYACRTPDDKDRKVPEEFKNYMNEMIDNSRTYKDFKAFALCFEAVVGYFYGEGGGKRK